MPRRPGNITKKDAAQERQLITEQRQLTRLIREASQVRQRRNALLATMYNDLGYEHGELATLASEGSARAGGAPLSEAAVRKAIVRLS